MVDITSFNSIHSRVEDFVAQNPVLAADSTSEGLILLIVAVVATVLGAGLYHGLNVLRLKDAKTQATKILDQAKTDTANLQKEAELKKKESLLAMQAKFDSETNSQRQEIQKREKHLETKDLQFKQATEDFRKQEKFVEQTQRRLSERLEEANKRSKVYGSLIEKQNEELQKLTGLSKEKAVEMLMENLNKELSSEVGGVLLKHERRLAEQLEMKSRDILLTTMQRFASTYTVENTTSTVDIPNDDMKGRIIGREGRNIRAFEKITGCDVIIDDTPGVVIVSGFDPVRREVARQSLIKLIADGRIHPARIEELFANTQKEIEKFIFRKGEEAAEEVGINNLRDGVVEHLGRLHFRTSYSQNVLQHSVEVAFLSAMMAEMIGLDPQLAKRCGLLHDIGKASDHETEGGHPKIGADLLKRFGENEHVVHAALGHHDLLTTEYPYTLLVATADACSASRPGARRESLERYVKRMEELETIARSFTGVEQAFAIQAGRELRVIANSATTDDAAAAKICRDIARAFEQQLQYPGEIKVTVVRESRFTELAR